MWFLVNLYLCTHKPQFLKNRYSYPIGSTGKLKDIFWGGWVSKNLTEILSCPTVILQILLRFWLEYIVLAKSCGLQRLLLMTLQACVGREWQGSHSAKPHIRSTTRRELIQYVIDMSANQHPGFFNIRGRKKIKQFLVKLMRTVTVDNWICRLLGWDSVDTVWFPTSSWSDSPSALLVKGLQGRSPSPVYRSLW